MHNMIEIERISELLIRVVKILLGIIYRILNVIKRNLFDHLMKGNHTWLSMHFQFPNYILLEKGNIKFTIQFR